MGVRCLAEEPKHEQILCVYILFAYLARLTTNNSLRLSSATTVVAPNLSFTYTPMLASVAVGSLTLFAAMEATTRRKSIQTYAAEAQKIDVKGKKVQLKSAVDAGDRTFELPYDILVIAVGCAVQDFGTPGVKEHAFYFKTVQDALAVRNRLIECFVGVLAVQLCLFDYSKCVVHGFPGSRWNPWRIRSRSKRSPALRGSRRRRYGY